MAKVLSARELVSQRQWAPQLFLFLYTLYHAGNAHLAISGMLATGPGRIRVRSIVDGIELLYASSLPVFPSLSASGRGGPEATRIRP
jgi:hypothetical protein